jgi:methionyl-tRNA formyltransferase
MKLVFCGTPQFAVPTLEALLATGHEVELVVTQPDRPQGRGLTLATSPVKQSALTHNLRIEQPEKIRKNLEFQALIEEVSPDAIIVVGYGRLIPPWMLTLPRFGNLNLHASLLPKYRGAAPIQWAIAEGETVSGVSTMRLDEGLDTGDILLQRELPIGADQNAVEYSELLAPLGAELMVETLRGLESKSILPRKQDDSKASLAPILKKEDGAVDFSFPADKIRNRLRGFQPWPGAYTTFRGRKLGIIAAGVAKPASASQETSIPQDSVESQGEIIIQDDRLLVASGKGSLLELLEVQPEGKRRMSAADFLRGYRPQPREKLGA